MDPGKEEKIRIAMEKLREAAVQKLFIKVFTSDGSTKSLLVDEKMSVGYVTRLLADKNHVTMEPKWCVLEHLPDLYMGEYMYSSVVCRSFLYRNKKPGWEDMNPVDINRVGYNSRRLVLCGVDPFRSRINQGLG